MSNLEEWAGVKSLVRPPKVVKALDDVQQSQPDVIILDWRLPGGSGPVVLHTVKQGENAPLAFVLTQYTQAAYRDLEAGADHFFDKASEFDRVLEVLEGFLNTP